MAASVLSRGPLVRNFAALRACRAARPSFEALRLSCGYYRIPREVQAVRGGLFLVLETNPSSCQSHKLFKNPNSLASKRGAPACLDLSSLCIVAKRDDRC